MSFGHGRASAWAHAKRDAGATQEVDADDVMAIEEAPRTPRDPGGTQDVSPEDVLEVQHAVDGALSGGSSAHTPCAPATTWSAFPAPPGPASAPMPAQAGFSPPSPFAPAPSSMSMPAVSRQPILAAHVNAEGPGAFAPTMPAQPSPLSQRTSPPVSGAYRMDAQPASVAPVAMAVGRLDTPYQGIPAHGRLPSIPDTRQPRSSAVTLAWAGAGLAGLLFLGVAVGGALMAWGQRADTKAQASARKPKPASLSRSEKPHAPARPRPRPPLEPGVVRGPSSILPTAKADRKASEPTKNASAPGESKSAKPSVSLSELPAGESSIPSDRARLVPPKSARGHRVFIDGKAVLNAPETALVRCGERRVRIGSHGDEETVRIPCGVEHRL